MSFSQFFAANWLLFVLLFIVLIAIAVYEFKNMGKSGVAASNIMASTLINNGAVLIDTRPVADFKKGHIAGAKNVPSSKFADYADNLSADNSVLIYCKDGMSAKKEARVLIEKGFKNVYTLQTGIEGWTAENLPLV